MQNNETRQWFAVYTKPRWEKKISADLHQRGIENYCPLNRVERQWSDRRKMVMEPLFRSYIFVRISKDEMVKPLEINGILHYVPRTSKPVAVRDREIEDIRRFLLDHPSVQLEKFPLGIDDPIEILYGPFMEKQGTVTQVKDNFVKVHIHSLGYSLVATVSRTGVRKLEAV